MDRHPPPSSLHPLFPLNDTSHFSRGIGATESDHRVGLWPRAERQLRPSDLAWFLPVLLQELEAKDIRLIFVVKNETAPNRMFTFSTHDGGPLPDDAAGSQLNPEQNLRAGMPE